MIGRIWLFSVVLLLVGCGYKPTSLYTKKLLGENIYVKVETSLEDPENSVLIRDAVNEAVIYKFDGRVSSVKEASGELYVRLLSVAFKPIEYDTNGYVIGYKTKVTLQTRYQDKEGKKRAFQTHGDYDFNIASNSVISDNKRFNAIKEASQKALDALISRLSVQGVKL